MPIILFPYARHSCLLLFYYSFKVNLLFLNYAQTYFSKEAKCIIFYCTEACQKQKYGLLEMIAAGGYKSSVQAKIPSAAMETAELVI